MGDNGLRRRHAPLGTLGTTLALAVLTLAAGTAPHLRAAVGSEPVRVTGSGTIGSGPGTQSVTIEAQTFREDLATFSLTEGDPAGSPVTVAGTVRCVGRWGSVVSVGVVMDDGRQGVVAISDGGTTGEPDTLRLDFELGGPDCTASYPPGTPLASGDFVVGPPACLAGAAPGPSTHDGNGDSIADVLQPQGVRAGAFCDGSTAVPTSGWILDGAGLAFFVQDAADPAVGVLVTVQPGSGPGHTPTPTAPGESPEPGGTAGPPPGAAAVFDVCGFHVSVDAGTTATLTCSSVRLTVLSGQAAISLGAGNRVVVPAGAAAEVTQEADGSFEVLNLGPEGTTIELVVGDEVTSLQPGERVTANAWVFEGFRAPVDPEPTVNVVSAGRAVPLRWRVVDEAGEGVTSITSVEISSTRLDCDTRASSDLVEETTSAGSGLKNLGNGYYELNWKTSRSYAGTCRTLHLEYGDGVAHDALFRFR